MKFSRHALIRLRDRGIDQAAAEAVVRHGAIRPDADCDFIAYSIGGATPIACACLDLGDQILFKTVYFE